MCSTGYILGHQVLSYIALPVELQNEKKGLQAFGFYSGLSTDLRYLCSEGLHGQLPGKD